MCGAPQWSDRWGVVRAAEQRVGWRDVQALGSRAAARRQCAGEKRDRARRRVRVRGAVPLGVVCLDGVMEEGTAEQAARRTASEERTRAGSVGAAVRPSAPEKARARGLSSRQVAPPRAHNTGPVPAAAACRGILRASSLAAQRATLAGHRSRAWMSCCGRAHAMPPSAPRRPSCGTPPAGLAPSRPRALAQGQEVICAHSPTRTTSKTCFRGKWGLPRTGPRRRWNEESRPCEPRRCLELLAAGGRVPAAFKREERPRTSQT